MYNILQLAMEFQRSPSNYADLTDPAKPLPENIDMLLEVAAGEVESTAINNDVAVNESISRELLSAATYFIEHALFIPKGNHYRTLGLEADANQELIRKHYHLLLKLLYLDREDKSDEWNTSYAMRINHAYSILRDPSKRKNYDQILSKQGIKVVRSDKQYKKEPDNAGASTSPGPSHAALADILTAHKESNRNKPTGGHTAQPAARAMPEPAPSKGSFIAGNINRAHGAVNGQDKAAATVTVNKLKVPGPGKEPAKSSLTSEELDSFEQLIKTQPTQRNILLEPADNNFARYRSITVMLSTVLLVVVIIYVFRQMTGDTDVQPEVAHVQESMELTDVSGNETTLLSGPLAVEEPLTLALAEEGARDQQQLTGSQAGSDEVPSISDIGQRRRRTIETITSGNVADSVARERLGESNTTNRFSATSKEIPKERPTQPERLPAKPVDVENKTPIKEAPVKQTAPRQALVSEKPVAGQVPEKTTTKKTLPPAVVAEKRPAPEPVPAEPQQKPAAPVLQESGQIPDSVAEAQAPPLSSIPTFVSMAPPQPEKQISNNISDRELKDFIADFIRGYEAGDLALFMNLFAEDARTPDQSNRQGIRKDYQELFQGTEKRQFIIDNLQWNKEDNNRATGEGNFKVIVQAPGDTALNSFIGRVTFQVLKGPQGIAIKRLEHAYGSGGAE